MKERLAGGKPQANDTKSEKLLKINAQTYRPYLAESRSKDRKTEQSKEDKLDWVLKPAY